MRLAPLPLPSGTRLCSGPRSHAAADGPRDANNALARSPTTRRWQGVFSDSTSTSCTHRRCLLASANWRSCGSRISATVSTMEPARRPRKNEGDQRRRDSRGAVMRRDAGDFDTFERAYSPGSTNSSTNPSCPTKLGGTRRAPQRQQRMDYVFTVGCLHSYWPWPSTLLHTARARIDRIRIREVQALAHFPKPPPGSWTENYPELGTAPVDYSDSIDPHSSSRARAIFKKTWLTSGASSGCATGSYFTKSCVGGPVIRDHRKTKTGPIKAVHTSAPRGTSWCGRLSERRDVGHLPAVLQVHAWRYSLDGDLTSSKQEKRSSTWTRATTA